MESQGADAEAGEVNDGVLSLPARVKESNRDIGARLRKG